MSGRNQPTALEYQTIAGQSCTTSICKKGELRMGIFFDGTGNDNENPKEFSNIKKLFDVYEEKFSKKEKKGSLPAYIRGVGSRKDADDKQFDENKDYESDSFMGGAWGAEGFLRINHMIYEIEEGIKRFKSEIGFQPKTIVLDVFGFSRGAIQARHFVNVIKQGFYQFSGCYSDYQPNDFIIETLNIFDSVSSFGILTVGTPGAPQDPGWAFNIKENWVRKITHFMADDEYRMHFDGQTVYDAQDLDYPSDMVSNSRTELIFLGAHSDIGGGYRMRHHGRSSNHLAKVYLNKMYDIANKNRVPLLAKPEKSSAWVIPSVLDEAFKIMQGYYEDYSNSRPNKDLKIAHKRFRERMAYLYDADTSQAPAYLHEAELGQKIKDNDKKIETIEKKREKIIGKITGWQILYKRPSRSDLYQTGKALNDTRSNTTNIRQQLEAYQALQAVFNGNKDDYTAFIKTAIDFHNTYVHKSHSASFLKDYDADGKETGKNREKMGMGAEIDGDRDNRHLHRHNYNQRPIDVLKILRQAESAKKIRLSDVSLKGAGIYTIRQGLNYTEFQWAYPEKMKD